MRHHTLHIQLLLLLLLSPAVASANPPPYWPPYPYYPMPAEAPEAEPQANEATPEEAEIAEIEETAVEEGEEPATTEQNEWELAREIRAAIQQGNFAEAYYLWRPRAEAGDADAQYGIGWMYHNGYGLAIDDEEASAWWELASHQGHIDATFALGMLYGLGEGPVKRDMPRAVGYYHQAANDGHEDARLLLRTLMAEGDDAARALMQQLLDEEKVAEITSPAAITRPKANIRRGPSTKHKVLTTLTEGHALMPLKREGRWLLVGIKGKNYTGWVHDLSLIHI